ncbi:Protein hcp1 [Alphaproteobacteria bacterium SO-S41]|nr:Protein hcp1 [Alphaproteobacteria bacterium SO-S41]
MASDYLLELDGIKGESIDAKHAGTIEVSSFSWGITQPGSASSGGGGGTGKASFQDLHVTTTVSKASTTLAQRCADGTHIKKATLFVRKAGKEQYDFYVITLEDLIVSSFQSGGGGHDLPAEQVSLNYAKIKFEYKEQAPDGSLKGAVKMTWDVKKNVA